MSFSIWLWLQWISWDWLEKVHLDAYKNSMLILSATIDLVICRLHSISAHWKLMISFSNPHSILHTCKSKSPRLSWTLITVNTFAGAMKIWVRHPPPCILKAMILISKLSSVILLNLQLLKNEELNFRSQNDFCCCYCKNSMKSPNEMAR